MSFGLPIATLEADEPGCLGAAILAGVGSGALPGVGAAQRLWCRLARVVEPDPAAHALYEDRLRLYRTFYPAVRALAAAL